ncbi:hypothetical protein ACFYYH_06665 [Streptomyces sp. NPDC002018]|uniref:hypothetical protein n=1 Tax=Streptomyces sp. NPDC002018 TaxID=3364629 RepID=UPI0036965F96
MPASPTAQATPDAPHHTAREALQESPAAGGSDTGGGGPAAPLAGARAARAAEVAAGPPAHRAAGRATGRSGGPYGVPYGEPAADTARTPSGDPAGELVRWATLGCLLVPVVLAGYGTSFGGTVVTTLGLAAVTAVCRLPLRRPRPAGRSGRPAAQPRSARGKMGARPGPGARTRTRAKAVGRTGTGRRACGRARNGVRMYGTYGTSGSRRSSGGWGARRSSRAREGGAPGD